ERGRAALDLAREGQRGATHEGEAPARLDADEDVHAARSARLRPADEPELAQQRLRLQRDAPHVGERDPRPRIEIDAQLVRVLEVLRADRMRVELDAAEIHDEGEAGRVVDYELLGGPSGREGEDRGAQPRRPLRGRTLLVEDRSLGAIDEALQHQRAIAN